MNFEAGTLLCGNQCQQGSKCRAGIPNHIPLLALLQAVASGLSSATSSGGGSASSVASAAADVFAAGGGIAGKRWATDLFMVRTHAAWSACFADHAENAACPNHEPGVVPWFGQV
jgi:hypothetical protein